MLALPRLYPILDAEALAHAAVSLGDTAVALRDAGVRFLQYRDKMASDAVVVERMRRLRAIFPRGEATLLLNDRVRLCAAAEADGVHVGQDDMAPERARELLGPAMLVGVSTHNMAQVRAAEMAGGADYLAIGPVFVTDTKHNPDPVVGLEGVTAARALTDAPLVAIGGITQQNAHVVIDAGADAVAVISGLLPSPGASTAERVRDFLEYLR